MNISKKRAWIGYFVHRSALVASVLRAKTEWSQVLSLLCAAELLNTVQFSEELWTFLNRRNIRAFIWHLMAQSYNWQVMSRCHDSSSYFIIFHHLLSHTCNDIHPHLKVFWFSFQLVILIWKQDFQWSCKDWSVRKHPQKNFKKHFYMSASRCDASSCTIAFSHQPFCVPTSRMARIASVANCTSSFAAAALASTL